MGRETGVQSQVESYLRLKKWYLMPPCLTLSSSITEASSSDYLVSYPGHLLRESYPSAKTQSKVRTKGNVEQSREWSSALSYTSV